MNIIDFWFLDSVSGCRLPVFAVRLPNIGEILNRPGHGLSAAEIAGRLRRLLDAGLLALFSREGGEPMPPPGDEELEALLEPPHARGFRPSFLEGDRLYGLTQAGGERWEAAVAADWSRFTTIGMGIEPDRCEVAAASEARLVEAMGFTSAVWDGHIWDPRDVRFERLEPWRPVYWKELPLGWRATYPLIRLSDSKGGRPDSRRRQALDRYWRFARWKKSGDA
jgi:hypothetical protein